MADIFTIIQSIVPEVSDLLAERLAVLRVLDDVNKRIGRKFISQQTNFTERTVRTILEMLKSQSLVSVNRSGVKLTQQGRDLIVMIDEHLLNQQQHKFYEVEEAVKRKLNIEHCRIVPGDADKDASVYQFLGQVVHLIFGQTLT